jgi:hypothetical protein
MEGRNRTPPALKLQQVRKDVLSFVKAAGKSGDIGQVLFVERSLLENDLVHHANSGAMKGSLEVALAELAAAERLIGKVRSPETYRETDAAHSLPKNRIGEVPRDEARQFFNSHTTRLVNWDKSRLDVEEKKIVDARKENMRAAGKVYAAMQRQALGLPALGSSKEQSQGMEL